MKRIKTFAQLFEAASMHENCEEFFSVAKGTEELKQIETWYVLHPTRTGRINVLSKKDGTYINNPGSPFFYNTHDGKWRFTFVSTGKYYGEKSSNDLIELLKTFIRDIIFKFAPADFNRKDASEMTDDDAFIFSKIWEHPKDPYIEYRADKRSDIITDFSLIKGKSKLIDRVNSICGNIYGFDTSNKNELSIRLGNTGRDSSSPEGLNIPDALLDMLGIKNVTYGKGKWVTSDGPSITIIPRGKGKKIIANKNSPDYGTDNIRTRSIKISLGYETVDELVEAIEKIITEWISKTNVYALPKDATDSRDLEKYDILTNLLRSRLLDGDDTTKDVDAIFDEHMKKNPLDIHLLDDYPQIKAGVLKRTGIRDYSAIGRNLKNGLI